MPYPNEHSCRLRDPDDFQPDSFRRVEREHDGKIYSVIMGRLKGQETMTEQAYRYDKETWTEAQARQHCQDHDGAFEPASDEHGLISGVECCGDERGGIEFRFVGSPRNPYGTHASKGYPGGREAWKQAWRIYLSRVRDQGPIQGTVRRVSMIAAAMKPPCKLPEMSAEDLGPREGPCGPLEGKIYQKPSDYNLSQWKKPSDDDLEQEDIQLTCQDLEDIKRICLQEIAKRQECAEKEKKARAESGNWIGIGDIEIRTFPTELRIITTEGKPTRIVGHAAVFGQLSEDLGGFRERIEPGAFAKTIREADIRALWNHDTNYVLGRTKNGTLRLWEDDCGLAFEVLPPNTQWAKDILITLSRGDVDQASFGFRTIRDRWENIEGQSIIRTLVEVKLFDISPVTFPAYPQTNVQVRSKVHELQRSIAAPGQEPHPAGADNKLVLARLAIMRRRLDLAEIAN